MKILLSIVIPTYNYAHLLPRAVESVIPQLEDDVELLIVNDGSTDHTNEVVVQLQNKYPGKFQYIAKENAGLAATRNLGVAKTVGDFLVFLDADDKLADDGLNVFRAAIKNAPSAKMIVAGYLAVHENGKKSYRSCNIPNKPIDRLRGYLLDKTVKLSNGAVAMHREIFNQYQYNPELRSSEDLPMFAYVLANYEITSTNRVALIVFKHVDSLRHNVDLAKMVGLRLVDEVFNPIRIPESLMGLKKDFRVQRNLSLSRICYLSQDFKGCLNFYCQALSEDWRVILRYSYVKNAIKSFFCNIKN